MSLSVCPHDDDPQLCPPCQAERRRRNRAQRPRTAEPSWSRPFTAKFDGTCRGGCGFDITAGRDVVRTIETSDGNRQTRHADCVGPVEVK